ncbi:methyltransferase domain-containing protein [Pedobacter sp. SD-b]|uniref:Methyltransferase domain-containing protein n=1 Tax=Pedobacter segetis TaxID=2793069 RepID=A0ABS1BKC0_9SPHI|nr:methyltransferase domain-containing protein [Pedobacter segetis]MBK0382659.1 methyltransferase domain-containing protein [Pedobacter segetis]
MKKEAIKTYFKQNFKLDQEKRDYLKIHAKRFETVLNILGHQEFNAILDIGPSFLSELLFQKFGNRLTLLGFDGEESEGGHLPSSSILNKTKLIKQDLNFFGPKADVFKTYDLIVCAEVMEHLYTSPFQLFDSLSSLLNKNGLLIIQTPNAVALRKRLAMLFGNNPFEIPRQNLQNPGHFREYTAKELINFGEYGGLEINRIIYDEYFEYPSVLSKFYRSFKAIIPKKMKSGITIVYKKP